MDNISNYMRRDPALAKWVAPLGVTIVSLAASWLPGAADLLSNEMVLIIAVLSFLLGHILQLDVDLSDLRNTVQKDHAREKSDLLTARNQLGDLSEQKHLLDIELVKASLGQRRPVQVKIANFNNFLPYVPLFVAIKQGAFRNEFLECSIQNHEDDLHAIKAMVDGECHFAVCDPLFMFDDARLEAQTRLIMPLIGRVAVWALTRLPLQSVLEGELRLDDRELKIVTLDEQSTAFRCASLLAKRLCSQGATISTGRPIALSSGGQEDVQHFFRRVFLNDCPEVMQADILVFSEPETHYLASSRDNGWNKFDLHSLLFLEKPFMFTAAMTTKELAESNPDLVRAFIKGLWHSMDYFAQLPDWPEKGVKFEDSEWAGVSRSVHDAVCTCYPSAMVPNGAELAAMIDAKFRSQKYYRLARMPETSWTVAFKEAFALAKPNDAVPPTLMRSIVPSRTFGLTDFRDQHL